MMKTENSTFHLEMRKCLKIETSSFARRRRRRGKKNPLCEYSIFRVREKEIESGGRKREEGEKTKRAYTDYNAPYIMQNMCVCVSVCLKERHLEIIIARFSLVVEEIFYSGGNLNLIKIKLK